ncbi:adrenocortical dysplasia protein homolog [Dendropsophus ebraccatus]|uniref:adrenocortical dysplasia protein homolog n=1 Tax=Dendropsophus ebraccatus TaxID=150705 RepID=UPI003831595A
MAGYHSFIGYPWIIDCLAKYDSAAAKQKPVPCQVVEFLKLPDHPVNSEECQYPEAVVNISDQKYYIRAVITKEAQQMLEREDEHFTLAAIKNKIIIVKKFSVCFAAAEDLSRCEFYLTVDHFNVLPMETNTVDLLNCNVEPGVRKKIKALWQNYITELEAEESSHDMNLSDVSLTQLLMIASEEKFSALKSVAEQCLELDPFVTQHNSPQGGTLWSTERRRNQNAEKFVIPIDLLLIPPHEEAVLEQITEFICEGQSISELADSSEGDSSSQPYSTALSTLSEEPVDEIPSHSGNPWNQLPSLCISVATSSGSQLQHSVNEVETDPDSSTPDILTSPSDVSLAHSPDGKSEISPLMFSENSSNPQQQQPSGSIPEMDSAHSDCTQGESLNTSAASLTLIPLTQNSPQRSLSGSSKGHISPIKLQISPIKSEIKSSTANKDLFSVSDENNRERYCALRTRKASKRKPTSEYLESTLSDFEQQEPESVERPNCVTTTTSSGDDTDKLADNNNGLQIAGCKQILEREAAGAVSEIGQNNRKTEQYIKTHVKANPISSRKRMQAHKPSLQFVVNTKTLPMKDSANEQLTAKGPRPSKPCIHEAASNATHRLSSFQAKEKDTVRIIEVKSTKLAHLDGAPFQYKYKSPSEDLCAHVKAIQIPADLCEWAVKILSEHQEELL